MVLWQRPVTWHCRATRCGYGDVIAQPSMRIVLPAERSSSRIFAAATRRVRRSSLPTWRRPCAARRLSCAPRPRPRRPTSPGRWCRTCPTVRSFLPPGTFGSMVFARLRAMPATAPTSPSPRLDAALAHAQARALRGGHHHPRQAAADRGLARAPRRPCTRGDRRSLSRRDRAVRRRALGRPDERRSGHPSATDRHERRTARAFRALGPPQGGHAGCRAPRHRCPRRRAHRHPEGAGLRAAAFPSRQPLRTRGGGMDLRSRLA